MIHDKMALLGGEAQLEEGGHRGTAWKDTLSLTHFSLCFLVTMKQAASVMCPAAMIVCFAMDPADLGLKHLNA
jgi:hypothetical protein